LPGFEPDEQVRTGDGPVADVVVDSVVALNGRRVSHHLYELEVELKDGSDKDLKRIEEPLRDAGAQAGDRRPKVFHVLGLDLPALAIPVTCPRIIVIEGRQLTR
jgi:hypothetical protein